jgi:hypothetical protein
MTTETTKKKNKYKVTAPDGTVFTRDTFRTYTYAVLFFQEQEDWRGETNFYGCLGYCGTKELAEKLMRTNRNRWDVINTLKWTFLIVPVEDR